MELHYSVSGEAISLVKKLEQELDALREMLRASVHEVRVDALYGMKLRESRLVRVEDSIEVHKLDGEEAIEAAIEVLTSIYLKEQQAAKETLRVPGAIGLPPRALEKVIQTNVLRTELASLVLGIPKANRRQMWRTFQAISPIQAMRTTHVLSDPQRLFFYWDTGASGHRHLVGDLIKMWEKAVKGERLYMPTYEDFADGAVEHKLLIAIRQLSTLEQDEYVYITRPVTPHIRCRFKDGDAEPKIVVAPTPFVYDVECPKPKVKNLETYTPHEKSEAGATRVKIESKPYIESMKVFKYLKKGDREGTK